MDLQWIRGEGIGEVGAVILVCGDWKSGGKGDLTEVDVGRRICGCNAGVFEEGE